MVGIQPDLSLQKRCERLSTSLNPCIFHCCRLIMPPTRTENYVFLCWMPTAWAFSSTGRYLLKWDLYRHSKVPSKSCVKSLFERLIYPNGRTKARTLVRRSRRCIKKEGQSNKKCSVSSMPSFVGHIGFIVSLKLWLNYLNVEQHWPKDGCWTTLSPCHAKDSFKKKSWMYNERWRINLEICLADLCL